MVSDARNLPLRILACHVTVSERIGNELGKPFHKLINRNFYF